MSQGYRDDIGKTRYDLVPTDSLKGVADVFTWACTARKPPYPERGWERGLALSRHFSAMMRHAWNFWRGLDLDPDSNLPTVDHMVCDAMMLASTWRRVDLRQFDNRENLDKRDQRAVIHDPLKVAK